MMSQISVHAIKLPYKLVDDAKGNKNYPLLKLALKTDISEEH